LSKKDQNKIKSLLDALIDKDIPELLKLTMEDTTTPADVKASRIGLVSTALHHLKLMRMAVS